jgi:GGDEF domain-containing protein
MVARCGGDEFVVLVAGKVRPSDARAIADRVTAAMAEPIVLGATTVTVPASVGVACASVGVGGTYEELVASADKDMYEAKAARSQSSPKTRRGRSPPKEDQASRARVNGTASDDCARPRRTARRAVRRSRRGRAAIGHRARPAAPRAPVLLLEVFAATSYARGRNPASSRWSKASSSRGSPSR